MGQGASLWDHLASLSELTRGGVGKDVPIEMLHARQGRSPIVLQHHHHTLVRISCSLAILLLSRYAPSDFEVRNCGTWRVRPSEQVKDVMGRSICSNLKHVGRMMDTCWVNHGSQRLRSKPLPRMHSRTRGGIPLLRSSERTERESAGRGRESRACGRQQECQDRVKLHCMQRFLLAEEWGSREEGEKRVRRTQGGGRSRSILSPSLASRKSCCRFLPKLSNLYCERQLENM